MEERAVKEVNTKWVGSLSSLRAAECWEIVFEDAEGKLHRHIFPKNALEWRAAEYEIDPEDTTTLLDIIMHEPFMIDPESEEDTVPKVGMRAAWSHPDGTEVPVTLFTAETKADARKAHNLRIKDAKTRLKISEPAKDSPLDIIRKTRLNKEQVKKKAERVDALRTRNLRVARMRTTGVKLAEIEGTKTTSVRLVPLDSTVSRREAERRMDKTDELYDPDFSPLVN